MRPDDRTSRAFASASIRSNIRTSRRRARSCSCARARGWFSTGRHHRGHRMRCSANPSGTRRRSGASARPGRWRSGGPLAAADSTRSHADRQTVRPHPAGLPPAGGSSPRSLSGLRQSRWEPAFFAARKPTPPRNTKPALSGTPRRTPSTLPSLMWGGRMRRTGCCATRSPPNGKRQAVRLPVGVRAKGASLVRCPAEGPRSKLQRYSARSYPLRGFKGDIEYCVLYAGESCRLIQDVKPAALIVHDLMREAHVALDGLGRS